MSKVSHIVRTQILELSLADDKEARDIQEEVSTIYKTRVVPIMEKLFDQLVPQEQALKIDRLELDIGELSEQRLHEELPEKIERILEDEIRRIFHKANQHLPDKVESTLLQPVQTQLAVFEHLLKSGVHPWNSPFKNQSLGQLFDQLYTTTTEQLQKVVREAITKTYIRKRLVYQFSDEQLHKLIGLMPVPSPGTYQTLLTGLSGIAKSLHIHEVSDRVIIQQVKETVLQSLSYQVGKTWTTAAIIENVISNFSTSLAAAIERKAPGHLSHFGVVSILKKIRSLSSNVLSSAFERHATEVSQSLERLIRRESARQNSVTTEEAGGMDGSTAEKRKSSIRKEDIEFGSQKGEHKEHIPKSKIEEHGLKGKVKGDADQKGNLSQSMDNTHPQQQELLEQKQQDELKKKALGVDDRADAKKVKGELPESEEAIHKSMDSTPGESDKSLQGDNNAKVTGDREHSSDPNKNTEKPGIAGVIPESETGKASKEDQPEINVRDTKQSTEDHQQAASGFQDAQDRHRTKSSKQETDFIAPPWHKPPAMLEEAFINNAGLALLWPYLAILFKGIGWVKDETFISEEAQFRAIHLLQFMVTGQTATEEQELAFNKLLVGMAPETPIPYDVELTPEEIEEAEHLLQSIMDSWKALKSSSIQALRQMFLQKEGILKKDLSNWKLYVERSSIDILLDKLPWSYSVVKLPWMDNLINVEW